jgi:hypothetical protein
MFAGVKHSNLLPITAQKKVLQNRLRWAIEKLQML